MTHTASTEYREQGSSFREHLTFVALLLPTFVVLAAAIISLATPEAPALENAVVTAAACEPCPAQIGDDGP